MLDLKPASVYVARRLDSVERATIAAALDYFTTALPIEQQLELLAKYHDEAMPLSPDAAVTLAREFVVARKVRVCRSKQSQA